MIGVPLGLFYSNVVEWLVHKYLLHARGKKKGSWWGFHWREHHKNVRRYGMLDPDYQRPITDWNARGKEAAGIAVLCAAHLPLAPVAPYFTATVFYAGFNYLRKHRRAHRDPQWAMENMKWHVDHHLGKNQDANWCVTQPWFDRLVGTRIDYDASALHVALPQEPEREPEQELTSGVHEVPHRAGGTVIADTVAANTAAANTVAANDAAVEVDVEDLTPNGPPSAIPPPIAA
jgi:sterol desaturase/sphingolipid hydroxylase (fatty acid hydroxylase superfamily)